MATFTNARVSMRADYCRMNSTIETLGCRTAGFAFVATTIGGENWQNVDWVPLNRRMSCCCSGCDGLENHLARY